jgi:2-hydroxy-3-keto-5-methylthiopentenyl-1-phosphate phosphatase
MLAVKALLVDFDGTACLQDVSEMLLDAFGEPAWERFDDAVDRGEMGLREAGEHQAAMLRGSLEEMLAFALERAELAPTFASFAGWADANSLPLTLASDGFAFYIRPILAAAGLGRFEVVTNELAFRDGRAQLRHPNGHPECIGCGTCKMLAARRLRDAHGPIAFVGEGQVRSLRRPVLGRRVRQGRARADLPAGRRAVSAVGHVRRRPGRARDDRDAPRSGRWRAMPGVEDGMNLDLPPGLTSRPATAADTRAILELIATCEVDADGVAEVDEARHHVAFGRRGFDPALDSQLVFEDGELVGWADLYRSHGEGDVLPTHRSRGIGTALIEWIERRAQALGIPR